MIFYSASYLYFIFFCLGNLLHVHVSALLHALTAISPAEFVNNPQNVYEEEPVDALPVTSFPCQWKPPRKRKESTLKMSEARFEKHTYGKARKLTLSSLEDFDPRPLEYRETANNELKSFLDEVQGLGLGVSYLFDPKTCYWIQESLSMPSGPPDLPGQLQLEQTVKEFKSSLQVSDDRAREIERSTCEQRYSLEWYSARRYRLTASHFEEIYHRRSNTPPGPLVLRLLSNSQIISPALRWGVEHEAKAIEAYIDYQRQNGHSGLTVCKVGFFVSKTHPFLGASPDGGVYDPTSKESYGYIEVKCPYSHRDNTPLEACADSHFFCTVVNTAGGKTVRLKHNHNYFCQVQGQMAIGERPWCDFVIYTSKGISVERITFEREYWDNVLVKLTEFYDKCFAPEVVSPLHSLGLPVRDLRKH